MITKVSFIVITYNSERTIENCIESIKKNIASQNQEITLVLIDNNSKDTSTEIIKRNVDIKVEIITNSKNIGFAKAVNQGLDVARKKFNPDFFFLLNPDASLQEKSLQEMLNFHKNKNEIVLSSPLIIDPTNNKTWFAGAKTNWFSQKTIHTQKKETSKPYQVDQLSGCALCIPKEALEKISEFDERFFLYYEDADFSLRAKDAGINSFIIPAAQGYHAESQSSDSETKCYHLVKSGLLFFHKNYPVWAKPYFWATFILRYAYHGFISRKSCVLSGMKDFLVQCTGGKERNSI